MMKSIAARCVSAVFNGISRFMLLIMLKWIKILI